MTNQEKEEPRLYSKPILAPVDIIAPQHQVIHIELEAYGRWNREKYQPGECESIEHNFDTGGRESKTPLVTLPENPRHRQIDQVVRYMRMWMNQHGEAVVFYYVGRLRRGRYEPCDPRLICRILHLHWSSFGPFMFDCRAAVINLLRRNGI